MRSPFCLSSRSRWSLVLPASLGRVPSRPVPVASIALLLVALAGCGEGEGIVLPGEGEPAAIAVVEGDDQRGRVGEPLNDPLVVQVTDTRGRPVAGATVAFDFASAGAGASVVPEQKTTDRDGRADARLVLGTSTGRQTGQARVVVDQGSAPIQASFSAMALPENANTMAAVAGQDQSGHVGLPLDDRLVVEVTDGFGNPVAGVPISWAAVGGGSVSEAVVETDEDGRSRVDRVLGPTVGPQSTVASADGLAGAPVTFAHTALAGDASRLVIVSGNDQTGEVGTVLPGELVVQLIDADGNGVPQTAVSWVVATGGGAPTPETGTTDGDGRTSARWTLGAALGQQRLDAVVSGVGIASFRATATAGAPASLFIRTQPSTSAQNGVPLGRQPVIQLLDSRGNDVAQAGVEITVAIGSGGGELGGTRQVSTDAAGRAAFTGLSISGAPGRRTLVFRASGYAQVTSNEIDLVAIGTSTTITSDSPDPSIAGSTFTVAFRVTSTGPIPTGTVTVTVSGPNAPSCSATLSGGGGSCPLTLNVVGDRTLTATYSGAPGLSGSSDTEPHRVDAPPRQNEAPNAGFEADCDDLTCRFTDESEDGDGTITSRSWNFGDGTPASNDVNPSHTYSAPGNYLVILTVTDNGGLTDQAQTTVSAEAPPPQVLQMDRQPSETATIGEPFGRQPRIQLRAGGVDVERSGVTISASIASGGGTLGGTTTATTDGNGQAEFDNLSISGAPGPHTLRFTADGFAEVVSNPVEVRKVSSAVRITSFQPNEGVVGESVRINFSVSGSGGTPTGNVTVTADEPGESCTGTVGDGFCNIVFAAPGDRDLVATYEGDARFAGDSDNEDIQINPAPPPPPPANVPPTAAFIPPSCTTGLPCDFTDSSSDSDGTIETWSWDFGSLASPANSSDQNPASITFAPAGTYPVTLTVTDDDGSEDSVTNDVTVTD